MAARIHPQLVKWLSVIVILLLAVAGWAFRETWLPAVPWLSAGTTKSAGATEDEHAHEHAGHAHAGHDETTSLHLSEQARRNIGLSVGEVALQDYQRTVSIPAMVVERPGWSKTNITAPLTGAVTGVYVVPGEAVRSEALLFKLRLTHADLVELQTEFLRTLGQLDVEKREIARLEGITSGVVAGKVLLERKYERDKLQAALSAEREALLLHGLSEAQVDRIVEKRTLIRELTVSVPLLHADSSLHDDAEAERHAGPIRQTSQSPPETGHESVVQRFVVLGVNVHKGDAVQAGDPLCVLGDFGELYIEGRAFEQDADELIRAANEGRVVSAIPEKEVSGTSEVDGLKISHVANEIDLDSRTLHFYVPLPNEVVRDAVRDDGRHFLSWRFKVGQRMQVRVPIETWQDAIVLPVDAVVQEGAEVFVFVENGDHFDRRPVHVEFRDQYSAVIADDGSLFPGDRVAMNAAHQLQMALKYKAGGGVAPHGHSH